MTGQTAHVGQVSPGSAYVGYDQWKGWTQLFKYTPDDAEYFVGETRGLRIADADVFEIGFGSGKFLRWAMDRGARVMASEVNPLLLAAAEAQGIDVVGVDMQNVADRLTGHFDTIVSLDVFEHLTLDTVRNYLRITETMLKPGGHILLRFPNAQSPFGLYQQYGDITHQCHLSRDAIEQLLAGTNLAVLRYNSAFRPRGRTISVFLVRSTRYLLRDLIAFILNSVYATRIPWDPAVSIVLQKRPA